jgi:hypothetical protein
MTARKKLAQLLLEAGVLDEYQLKSALGFQQKWGGRLIKVLVENRFISEEALVEAIRQQTGLAVVELDNRSIPDYLLALVPRAMAAAHHLVPVALEGGPGPGEGLVVAMSDPTDQAALDELRFKIGRRVRAVLGGEGAIERALVRHYPDQAPIEARRQAMGGGGDGDLRLVQGQLESPPRSPTSGLGSDPFAELDALASGRQPALSAPPGLPDAPVTTGEERSPHPASTALDFEVGVDEFFAGSPQAALSEVRPAAPASAPPGPVPEVGGGDLELIEDIELLEEAEEEPVPAARAVSSTELAAIDAAFAAGAGPGPSAQGPPREVSGEPLDLSLEGDLDLDAALEPLERQASEPTQVSRISADLARAPEARPAPTPAPQAAVAPKPLPMPAPLPAGSVPAGSVPGAAPAAPGMQALLAKVGIGKPAQAGALAPSPALAGARTASAGADAPAPAPGYGEDPWRVLDDILSDDPALHALVCLLVAKGVISAKELAEAILRG